MWFGLNNQSKTMGAQISQVQSSQGNQPVNPPATQDNYSPAQQQMGGKGMNMRSDGLDQNAINANPAGFQQFRQDASQQGYQYGDMGGKGQRKIYSPLSNQPTMGQPNPYPNTIGQWDNASIQPQPRQGGKGKGY
jgi:hypothetical protein